MLLRAYIRLSVGLLIVLAASGTRADNDDAFPADALAKEFMSDVAAIQAETSIQNLKNRADRLNSSADFTAHVLGVLKTAVEKKRSEIQVTDNEIQACQLSLASVSGDKSQLEGKLAALQSKRAELCGEERESFRSYGRCRGLAIVSRITIGLLLKEIDKRIAQLGTNTADGTWSSTYTSEDGIKAQQGGSFSLLIDAASGAISGNYVDGGELVQLSGNWNAASGACSGTGNDPSSTVTWQGTLTKGPKGYAGRGTLTYKPKKDGGSGSGTWSTK